MTTEIDEKTERLIRLAHDSDVAGILLATQPGFAWLTGGRTNRIDGSRENGSGALFVRADERRFVIANNIEMPRLLAEEIPGGEWEAIEYPWTEDHARADTLVRLAASTGDSRRIGADLPLPDVVPLDRPLMRMRIDLVAAEVERYRRLGHETGVALGGLCKTLVPGQSEQGIARLVSDAALEIGGRAIVVLVAADERMERFRHPVPKNVIWRDRVMVVACIQRGGLVVALSRIVSAEPAPPDLTARTRAAAGVFRALVDATLPGTTGRELFGVAKHAYAEQGYPGEEMHHHQGGATGYRSREWLAHPASEEEVQVRQAFAWNPTIRGTKIEDTILITTDGVEVITTSPAWPLIDGVGAEILALGL